MIDGGPATGTASTGAGMYLMSRPPGATVTLRLKRAGGDVDANLVVGEPQAE